MFRNCLAAALRHLARNRLYTAISVMGLAIGLSTALIATLVIHNQYSYDHFVPGYERTYFIQTVVSPSGMRKQYVGFTPLRMAGQIRENFPQVEAVSRVLNVTLPVEYGGHKSSESIYWADSNLPEVLPPATYAGDVAVALRTADSLVLSRSYARRFFGSDAPLGQTLMIDGHAMIVRAVVEDPPTNGTHETRNIIASGISSFSPMSTEGSKADTKLGGVAIPGGYTYVRVKPGIDLTAFSRAVPRLLQLSGLGSYSHLMTLELIRIDRANTDAGMNPGFRNRMLLLGILGAVVLLIAAVNFVNLQTARAALRARETAIRALAGAGRHLLILQFLAEALIYATAAGLLAIALTEWLLPHVNAFLDTGAVLDYHHEPALLGTLTGATLLLGLLAGAWPAFVQSGFRPVQVLRGTAIVSRGAALRQGLVALQFALLIALAISAGVVYRQMEFATRDALRFNHDQVLWIYAPGAHADAYLDELKKLPGVRATTRSSIGFLGSCCFMQAVVIANKRTRSGDVAFTTVVVDLGLFDFYAIKPLAGALPTANATAAGIAGGDSVVLNETAARKFGLGSPAQALGKTVPISNVSSADDSAQSIVLAVVPDFSFDSAEHTVPPVAFFTANSGLDLISARLSGRDIPETLVAIDALWQRLGNATPPRRAFLDQQLQQHYQGVLRQSQAFGVCALIALALSCAGLFALTSATAERRTKEIGVRKALGADTGDVLRLLLWQFSKPVLWGCLLAWPVAGYAMDRWLGRFAGHIDLPLWLFPTAACAALIIALATVTTQSVLLARARPMAALRHE
ncbi:MAG TPA: FtsX-like permease family protein [Steroidobacteraceae bacterium]|nr:FtsX-like permease family protein [Steroidobacteraceae bacterium]